MKDYETEALLYKSKEAWSRTEAVLKRLMGEKRQMRFLSINDRKRLTVLLVWEQRYKVSLEWIVEVILKYYQHHRSKHLTGKRGRTGLPVKVPTFVSQTAKEVVELAIAAAYPNDEHIDIWRGRMQCILSQLDDEFKVPVMSKSFIDFAETEDFVKQYGKDVRRSREGVSRMLRERKKKGKPYRNSPWR